MSTREDLSDFGDFEAPGGIPDALRDPLGILRRRWRWMLAAFVVGLAATIGILLALPPRYEATARIMVTTAQIRDDLVRTPLLDDIFQRIDAMLGLVLSTRLEVLIARHDPYPELASLSKDEIQARAREDIHFEQEQGLQRHGELAAAIFQLRFEARTPEIAAGFANDLANELVNQSISSRNLQADRAVEFLETTLEDAERDLRTQSREIREFKEQHRGELPEEQEANLARLERLQQQRQSLALQIAEANTRLAMLTTPASGPEKEVVAESPEVRLERLRTELRERLSSLTDRHPDVQSTRREIAQLEEQLRGTGKGTDSVPTRAAMITAAQQTVAELQRQLAQAEQDLEELDHRVAQTPSRQEELDAMLERETVLRDQYVTILRKVKEAKLAESLEKAERDASRGNRLPVAGGFMLVQSAEAPAKSSRPHAMYLVVGIAASLGLAAATGLLLETLDPVLVSRAQLERESGLPVLGSAPRIS